MIFLPRGGTDKEERGKDDKISVPNELPILPLRGTVLFPDLILPIMVGRKKSVKLIDDAMDSDRIIGIITQKRSETEDPKENDLYSVGVAALILRMIREMDGSQRVIVQGISRIKVGEYIQREPYFKARSETIEEGLAQGVEIEALMMNLKNLFQRAVELAPYLTAELGTMVNNVKSPPILADLIASNLNLSTPEKQGILETFDVRERLTKVHLFLNKEVQVLELGNKIQSQVKEDMDRTQREYYLREQLKAIKKELGELDEHSTEIKELREKIKKAKMPPEALATAEKELDRLAKIPPVSAEYTVARTYLDWLAELPWSETTGDNLDIDNAQKILDEDHYDLEKVKERILEYLAVRKLKSDLKGPILCFVGPPGVGKTSLGMSIARALGRKFNRISLGGMHDEAEIRGHRRTYIGSLPGRVIQGIRRTGSNNPVFMLDEVDKIGQDFRGDPAAALLEVLDPEQNHTFSDHYLEVPFDLSKVMFITTANILDPIPAVLRDRMEVLELPGYTDLEKLQIAKKYLIPKELENHGLKLENLTFQDQALKRIINDYTKESGLRNLDREIATICRKVAKKVASDEVNKVDITSNNLHEYLGPPKFFQEVLERTSQIGVVPGLAWTSTGGEILFVEATKMKGKRSLTLTGHLGEVMKESAQTALSYVRSTSHRWGIPEDFFEKYDIHVHVPAGSIPKDGPSAGITMATAIVSLLSERPVKPYLAMSGEITLRGQVLPIGGLKEKTLAAYRAGIKTVILSKHNEKDLEEVPEEIKKKIKFVFVKTVDEVLGLSLDKKRKSKK